MENYGILTLIPLVLMLILVLTTKRVLESIIISLVLVFIMSDGTGFLKGILKSIFDVFDEGIYPWILLCLTLFGALIKLLIDSGGIAGFKKVATHYIKSERSSLVFTWILGLIFFVDDYINNLGIGPTVRDITDQHKVPREELGFIICSMGTPICSIIPLSGFAAFIFGIMKDVGISNNGANMIYEYAKIIPFMFYPMAIIIIAFLLAIGVMPKIGKLKKIYNNAKSTSSTDVTQPTTTTDSINPSQPTVPADSTDSTQHTTEFEHNSQHSNLIDFLIPVAAMVVSMVITSDIILSVVVALITAFILYIPRKIMKVDEYFQSFFKGVNDMTFILVIVLLMFTFVEGINAIGFDDYVVDALSPLLVGGVIPALMFVAVGVVSFLGVDYWAIVLLLTPIAAPLALQFGVNQYMTMAAIASGAIFGGSSCFFAEQILMTSQSVQRPPAQVALCALPYNIIAFILTTIMYLMIGFAF